MEYIKQWALGLVLTSVIGTVILIISPSGAMEKQVRLAVSLVLLIMFVKPLVGLSDINGKNYKKYEFFTESTSYNADEYFVTAFKDKLNDDIVELIDDKGINVIKTEIDVSINDVKEISVDRVVVFIVDKNKISTVKHLIEKEYGIIAEVEVIY